jgi:hypothetical protein
MDEHKHGDGRNDRRRNVEDRLCGIGLGLFAQGDT